MYKRQLNARAAAQATIEGALLAAYRFDAQKKKEPAHDVARLTVVEFDAERIDAITAGARGAEGIAAGVSLARDLVNMPPNVATPTRLAAAAEAIAAAHGLNVTIGDREWAAARHMGAFLSLIHI